MRNRTRRMLSLACMLIATCGARSLAQDVGKENDDPKAVKAMVEEAVGWYPVFIDADAREAIPPQPVLLRNVTARTAGIGRHSGPVGSQGAARGFGERLPMGGLDRP